MKYSTSLQFAIGTIFFFGSSLSSLASDSTNQNQLGAVTTFAKNKKRGAAKKEQEQKEIEPQTTYDDVKNLTVVYLEDVPILKEEPVFYTVGFTYEGKTPVKPEAVAVLLRRSWIGKVWNTGDSKPLVYFKAGEYRFNCRAGYTYKDIRAAGVFTENLTMRIPTDEFLALTSSDVLTIQINGINYDCKEKPLITLQKFAALIPK